MPNVQDRYRSAMHKIQSFWALSIGRATMGGFPLIDTHAASPKHLKVGVESALGSVEGLVDLLVAKGIITAEEYGEACTKAIELRAERCEKEAQEIYGPNVRLG